MLTNKPDKIKCQGVSVARREKRKLFSEFCMSKMLQWVTTYIVMFVVFSTFLNECTYNFSLVYAKTVEKKSHPRIS